MEMKLFILTHGRHKRQVTYENLPQKWKDRVTFVIQEREFHKWKLDCNKMLAHQFLVLPDNVRNLHQTRQWLLINHHEGKVVEMDDDIVFSARRTDEPTKFRPMEDEDFDQMFRLLEHALDEHHMAGIVAREGANRNIEPYLYTTRQMRLHAFNADYLWENDYRWDALRSPGPEDFCMLLQLMTKGHSNCVVNDFCQNQGGSNVDGGVSEYRTLDVHADACEHLAEMYPDFVTVVEKETKGSWGGGVRKDVRIQWKKALEYGKRHAS